MNLCVDYQKKKKNPKKTVRVGSVLLNDIPEFWECYLVAWNFERKLSKGLPYWYYTIVGGSKAVVVPTLLNSTMPPLDSTALYNGST